MSNDFYNRLNRVLSGDFDINEMAAGPLGGPDPQQFLEFLNAIVTSSDHARTEQALQRAKEMPPEQLAQVVSQTESLGNFSGLADYLRSKLSRIMGLIDIARNLYEGPELEAVVDSMMKTVSLDQNEGFDAEGDFYYDQGDDSDGH